MAALFVIFLRTKINYKNEALRFVLSYATQETMKKLVEDPGKVIRNVYGIKL
jgi:hypothetical protein